MPKKKAKQLRAVAELPLEYPPTTGQLSVYRVGDTLTLSFDHKCGKEASGGNFLLPVPSQLSDDERFNDIATNLVMFYITHSIEGLMLFAADTVFAEAIWFARKKLGAEHVNEERLLKWRTRVFNDVMRNRLRMRGRGNVSLWSRDELIELVREALNHIKRKELLNYDNAAKEINKLYKEKFKVRMTGDSLRVMLTRQTPPIKWMPLRNERKKAILEFAKSKQTG